MEPGLRLWDQGFAKLLLILNWVVCELLCRSRTRSRSPVTSHRRRESRSPSRSIRSISRSRSASVRSDRSRSIDSRDRD
nr:serine/arginine-rich splicing factor RS2Z33-like [Quercus suber]